MKQALVPYGWLRVVIYILGLLLISICMFLVAGYLNQVTANEEYRLHTTYISVATGFLVFTWLMLHFIDRKSYIDIGIKWKGYSADGWIGLCTAVAMLGIASIVLLSTGFVFVVDIGFSPIPMIINLLLMIIVAVTEEIVFRGYILNNLLISINKWTALIVSSIVFTLFHASNPEISLLPLINIFLAGILLGSNYIFTRNLWFGILLHFGWNFLQGPVLGFEVSGLNIRSILQLMTTGPAIWTGGEFGFEGSAICTLLLIIFMLLWLFLFHKKYNKKTNKLAAKEFFTLQQ